MRTQRRAAGRESPPKTPKDIAGNAAARAPFDRAKLQRESRRASQAADRLLREMDDVLKHLDRKT